MTSLHVTGGKISRTMGFALTIAFLSFGAISGCGSSNDDNDLFGSLGSGGSDGSDGFMGGDETPPAVPAANYPDIQSIPNFLPLAASGKTPPLKVQYWDQTYFWQEDSSGQGGSCFTGTVGIETSANIEQYVAAANTCPPPSPFGTSQVTVCNPDVGPDVNGNSASAGGAVQPGPRQFNCSGTDGANACTDVKVSGPTTQADCHRTVTGLAPLAAGTVWFQDFDASPTKGGSASHFWYGTRATSSFDPKDTYGGTLVDYINDANDLNIAASGGGSDEGGVNNIYLCSQQGVLDPKNSPDICTLSSLFGNCDGQKLDECKIKNIQRTNGAYNVFITSAKPISSLLGGGIADTTLGFETCAQAGGKPMAFRMDDIQDNDQYAQLAQQSMLQAFINKKVPLTAGFVGKYMPLPSGDIGKLLTELHKNKLLEVGNHSFNHKKAPGWTADDINKAVQAIQDKSSSYGDSAHIFVVPDHMLTTESPPDSPTPQEVNAVNAMVYKKLTSTNGIKILSTGCPTGGRCYLAPGGGATSFFTSLPANATLGDWKFYQCFGCGTSDCNWAEPTQNLSDKTCYGTTDPTKEPRATTQRRPDGWTASLAREEYYLIMLHPQDVMPDNSNGLNKDAVNQLENALEFYYNNSQLSGVAEPTYCIGNIQDVATQLGYFPATGTYNP